MPDKFHVGSPLATMPESELLLPGQGYESAHDVTMDFPVSADILGLNLPDTVRSMLGLYPHNASKYASNSDVDRKNREILAASTVFDANHNISGMHDGIIRSGRYNVLQKIRGLSGSDLDNFIGPTNSDVSEMNWYLKETGASVGVLSYQFNGQAIMNYPVKYSAERYSQDIDTVRKARVYAQKMYESGVGFGSEGYSHIDRLNILANVAPYSDEYRTEELLVQMQIKAGYPQKDQLEKIRKKRKAIMMQHEMYPYRFKGNIMTPDSKYNNLSLNENIKAADQYSLPERIVGAMWENVSHMNTPVHSKFMNYRTPLEAYQRGSLYGRDLKMWSHPIDHFMDAYARGFMSKTGPLSGGWAGAMAGTLTMGPGFGTVVGAGVGAVYSGVHGVYRSITGTTYIPGSVREARTVNRYFDKISYVKNMMLYNATGDERYMEEARGTMTGLNPSDLSRQGWSYMYRATPSQERPYIIPFITESDPEERERITKYVPDEVSQMLRSRWAASDTHVRNTRVSMGKTDPIPTPDWIGYSPEVPLEDVKLKFLENKSMEYHDFGLGFHDQMQRVNESPWLDRIAVDMNELSKQSVPMIKTQKIHEMRRTLEVAMRSLGLQAQISITPSALNTVTVVNN
jgi:hypothetical protein